MTEAFLLVVGIITQSAWGQVGPTGGFESSALGTGDLGVQVRGKVICTGCSLEEARNGRSDTLRNHLYHVVYRQHQLVMEVDWVSHARRWSHYLIPHLRLRGADDLLAKLTAEENLHKAIALSGILSPSRILDVNNVTVLE
jgi:hypothetical protein